MSFEISSPRSLPPHELLDPYRHPEITAYVEVARECIALLAAEREPSTADLQACFDYARTVQPTTTMCTEDEVKMEAWLAAVEEAQSRPRGPRTLDMNLHPEFFHAIAGGSKRFEGRVALPGAPKDYPNIRPGDQVVFTLQPELAYLNELAARYRLHPGARMYADIEAIVAGPTVHSVYSQTEQEGTDFQPMIAGQGLLATLRRIAQYYRIYPNQVPSGIFLGLRLNVSGMAHPDPDGEGFLYIGRQRSSASG